MINRDNYQAAKMFLHNLENSRNVQETSKGRYWSYLKTILIWGDETPLIKTPSKQPTLPKFLETFRMDGEPGSLAAATRKKILQTAQRLFTWLKLNLPKDFSQLPNDWIDGFVVGSDSGERAARTYLRLGGGGNSNRRVRFFQRSGAPSRSSRRCHVGVVGSPRGCVLFVPYQSG